MPMHVIRDAVAKETQRRKSCARYHSKIHVASECEPWPCRLETSTVGQMSVCVRVSQGGVSVVTHCLEKETRPKNGVHGREYKRDFIPLCFYDLVY